ncbi:MAG: ATP-binding protein [Deltaproteobacteria bacterium]|nr:ATP-binding protein [Deltaproteobacteria bacterium]
MYLPRLLDLRPLLEKKSLFLFGPRQTGKSSLIQHQFPSCRFYDLLDSRTLLSLGQRPERLEEELGPRDTVVVIDEIQKLPNLLDEVHRLIESRKVRFLLTGSSARKLRRGGVNLLGGRAWSRAFHPFIYHELGDQFDLLKALNRGLIPSIYLSDNPEDDLEGYAGDYLKEEIAAEGLTRNIPAFSRFLEVAASCNGQMIDYTSISNDAQIPRTTVHEYFQILKDTLIAHELPAWQKSQKRKPITTSKFYLFDWGVVRHLQHRQSIQPRSPEFGEAFEAYLFHEMKTFVDYTKCGNLYYWRSKSRFEVDFVIEEAVAVEVKAKTNITPNDLKGLLALQEEKKIKHLVAVSLEKTPRVVQNIQILPWSIFLTLLWERKFA